MLKRSLRSKDLAVERLSWTLLAALSGASVGMSACAGRSERFSGEAEAGDGGTSGSGSKASGGTQSKGTGGTTTGTGGTTTGTGGTTTGTGGTTTGTGGATTGTGGSDAGTGAFAGTNPQGGTGSGGTGNGGTAGEPPRGCAAAGPYGDLESCEGGYVHRPHVTTCALPDRVGAGGEAGQPGTGGTGGIDMEPIEHRCDTDLDCVERANGYCTIDESSQVGPTRGCVYACAEDSDCGSGEICSCSHSFVHASGETIQLGVCRQATCASDADCGDGLFCIAPVDSNCGPARPVAYACQTAEDECAGPGDCADFEQCVHDGTRFACEGRPTCGRPFVVLGAARVASLEATGDWADAALAARPCELDAKLRAEVARYFVDAGLMEHASIAAFARFALQLLALGAPAELVAETTRAMEDETRHAKLCFGLAARYGSAAGPGPLELAGALETFDLLSIADLVITEGCIGETSAALEAAWAAEAAADPELRAVLSGIAEDELRHAALAFRFIAWAAERDARVQALLSRRVREACAAAALAPPAARHAGAAALAAHGVLDPATRAEARRRALEEIVSGAALALSAAPRGVHFTSSMTVVSQPNKSSTLPAGSD